MDSLVYTLLNNALAVTVMAVVVVSLSWIFRRPAVTHCLWLIVILKLITPPLVPLSLSVGFFIPPIESSRASMYADHATGFPTHVETPSRVVANESSQFTDDLLAAVNSPRLVDDELDLGGALGDQLASGPVKTEPSTPLPNLCLEVGARRISRHPGRRTRLVDARDGASHSISAPADARSTRVTRVAITCE